MQTTLGGAGPIPGSAQQVEQRFAFGAGQTAESADELLYLLGQIAVQETVELLVRGSDLLIAN